MPSWSLLISQSLICNMNEHVLVGEDLQQVSKLLPISEKNRGLDIQLCHQN